MSIPKDINRLADALNDIAVLYQFRDLNKRLYGTLTVSQSYCLRILFFQGMRTMSHLAAQLQVRLSTITGVIDQLEAKGLVERKDNPDDRRSLQVQLTRKGRNLYCAAHEAFLSHLRPLLDGRPPVECEKIFSFLTEVTDSIRGWQKNPYGKAKRFRKSNS